MNRNPSSQVPIKPGSSILPSLSLSSPRSCFSSIPHLPLAFPTSSLPNPSDPPPHLLLSRSDPPSHLAPEPRPSLLDDSSRHYPRGPTRLFDGRVRDEVAWRGVGKAVRGRVAEEVVRRERTEGLVLQAARNRVVRRFGDGGRGDEGRRVRVVQHGGMGERREGDGGGGPLGLRTEVREGGRAGFDVQGGRTRGPALPGPFSGLRGRETLDDLLAELAYALPSSFRRILVVLLAERVLSDRVLVKLSVLLARWLLPALRNRHAPVLDAAAARVWLEEGAAYGNGWSARGAEGPAEGEGSHGVRDRSWSWAREGRVGSVVCMAKG